MEPAGVSATKLAARDGHHRRRKGWQRWCLSSPIDACAWCHNNKYANNNAGGNDDTNQNNNQQTWAACYAIGSSPLNPAESEFLSTMGGYLPSSQTINASGDKSDYTAISNKRQGLNYEFGGCGWLELGWGGGGGGPPEYHNDLGGCRKRSGGGEGGIMGAH